MGTGIAYSTIANVIIYSVIAVILIVTIIKFVQLRRKATHPHLSLHDLVVYRGETQGRIVCLDDDSIEASYMVDGLEYFISEPIAPLDRVFVQTGSRTGREIARYAYTTTTLGEVLEGGTIRVRYRQNDPSEAVLRPNPVVLQGRLRAMNKR